MARFLGHPNPLVFFLSSFPSHHESNFLLWTRLLIPPLPCPSTISSEMTLSTGTTRLRSATMASTWALKSPSTLCLSMRCRHLHLSTHSLSNNLTTTHTFNLLKWDLHQPSLPTESCTMEDCYLPSSRTTRLLICKTKRQRGLNKRPPGTAFSSLLVGSFRLIPDNSKNVS